MRCCVIALYGHFYGEDWLNTIKNTAITSKMCVKRHNPFSNKNRTTKVRVIIFLIIIIDNFMSYLILQGLIFL